MIEDDLMLDLFILDERITYSTEKKKFNTIKKKNLK